MRRLWLIPLLWLAAATAHAELRRPLTLPVRVPGSNVPSPAYAGDVITVRLTPAAARAAWQSRAFGASAARVGVPGLDRAAAEIGIRWEPEFPGWRPPASGSREPDLTAFYVAHLASGVGLSAALDRLSTVADVASADPVPILPMSALPPSDSLFSVSYWYQQASRRDLHALEAWALTTGDTSIVVGIVDTGVLAYHPDIGGDSTAVYLGQRSQIWTNPAEANGVAGVDDDGNGFVDDVHGWDFVSLGSPTDAASGEDWQTPDNDPSDFAAHGTAVAGVVGALSDNVHGVTGTSWNVRLLPLRVGWACNSGGLGCGEVRMDFAAQAIAYAALMRIPVINCSFESIGTPDLIAALDAAHAAGVTVVAAAGNDGQPVQFTNNFLSERPEVLSIASVGATDQLSAFTNYGPEIDLCAPGEGIASTYLFRSGSPPTVTPIYHPSLSGTSIAAPFVSGGAALVSARQRQLGRPSMTQEGMILRLEETADDIGDVNGGKAGQFGAGRLNLGRAVSETWRSTATRIGDLVNGSMAWVPVSNGGSRIAFATVDQHLVILDSGTLDTIAVSPLPRPPTTGVTIGPIGPNGGVGIFVGCQGLVAGFHPTGGALSKWPAPIAPTVQVVSGPMVGDLDGDGAYEVICGTDDGRVFAWHIANPSVPVTGFPAQVTSGGIVYVALAHDPAGPGLRVVAAADDGTLVALGPNGQPVSAAWQMALNAAPTAPAVTTWNGTETVVLGAGSQLHAFLPDGTERSGFPVDLGAYPITGEEPALGDVDLDGSDDVVIATTAPDRLDVRDASGQSKLNWPRTLDSFALGSPVIGQLAPDAPPEIMIMLVSGLTAFTAAADSLPAFPKFGGAGQRPTLIDIDGDGTTEVLAGSGTSYPARLYVYDAGPGTAISPVKPWITFRGDFARTGNRGYAPTATIDLTPPSPVTDLHLGTRGSGWVLLWTAPSDNGPGGRATSYDLRYDSHPITAGNFDAALSMPAGTPAAAGAPDSAAVTSFSPGIPIYFALKALDADGNASPVSNTVGIQLPSVPIALAPLLNPARPPAVLRWEADPRAAGQRQALRIHDLGGRVVRTIELGTGSGGTASWDGKDDDGRRLPAGLYLVRLVSGGYHANARLVLLP